MATRSKETSVGSAYWMLAVLTILYMVSMIDRQVIGLLIPAIKADLGLTDVQISLLTGPAFAVFYCLAGLPIGYMVDRHSRRLIIFIGLTIWGIATMGCGLATGFTQLLVARFMVGTGEASLSPASYSLFGDAFPRHRLGLATAVFGGGATLGTSLAYALGGLLTEVLPAGGISTPLGHLAPWQATFILVAIPALVCTPLLLTVRDPARTKHDNERPSPAEAARYIFSRLDFFGRLFIGYGLLLASAYSFSVWGPAAVVRKFDISIAQASVVFSLCSVIGVPIGALLVGFSIDRFVSRSVPQAQMRIFALIAAGQIGFSLLFAATSSYAVAVVAIFGMFVASGFPSLAAAIPLTTPSHLRGQVSAAYLMVGSLVGMAIGPIIPALLTDRVFKDPALTTWSIALTLLGAGSLAILLFLTAHNPMRRALLAGEP